MTTTTDSEIKSFQQKVEQICVEMHELYVRQISELMRASNAAEISAIREIETVFSLVKESTFTERYYEVNRLINMRDSGILSHTDFNRSLAALHDRHQKYHVFLDTMLDNMINSVRAYARRDKS
jgi:hypothetical protein